MDATERVREKEELRRANERLEILTALSNDVLFDIECGTGKAHVYGDFEGRFGRAPQQEDFRGEPPLPKAVRAGYYFPRPDAAHDTDRRELTRRF